MKYIKLFESMTEVEVERICDYYGIKNWTLRSDGLVDVDGDVNLIYKDLTKLPLQFGRVTGSFYCFQNSLTTLKGGPKEVEGAFYCDHNNLTTLEGAPQEVGRDFLCFYNNLTTLEGGPKEVGGGLYCYYNNLTTLKGAPEYVGEVDFLPNENLPTELLRFLKLNNDGNDLQTYIIKWQKDYAIWRKDGSLNQSNFIRLMEDAHDELENIKYPK